jgi:hypothetical protein
MLPANNATTSDSLLPWQKPVRAIAIILGDEFGVPFRFHDVATGRLLEGFEGGTPRTGERACPPGPAPVFETSSATAIVAEGTAGVRSLEAGFFQLELPFSEIAHTAFVAVGVIAGLARTPAEVVQEKARLGKWLCAVHHRLVTAYQASERQRQRQALDRDGSSLVGLEALMSLEHLLRTQRFEKTPARNRTELVQAAALVVRAGTLVWVSSDHAEPLIEGEPILSPWDCAQLAGLIGQDPEASRTGYLRNNHVAASGWGVRFPRIATLLAVPVPLRGAASWLIALNKAASPERASSSSSRGSSGSGPPGQASFRRTDAALLSPYAALLAVHLRAARQHHQFQEILAGLNRTLAASEESVNAVPAGDATASPREFPASPSARPG